MARRGRGPGGADQKHHGLAAPQRHHAVVIGLAGRLGAGCSFVRDALVRSFRRQRYEPFVINVSEVFLVAAPDSTRRRTTTPAARALKDALSRFQGRFPTPDKRIRELQKRGNTLRKQNGTDYLAKCAARFVAHHLLNRSEPATPVAFIVDSLKHPDEARYLRQIFGDAFFLAGVVASDFRREERLRERKDLTGSILDNISEVDKGEKADHGQHALDTIVESDYFILNNYTTPNEILPETDRFLELVFNTEMVTPRPDEYGMALAYQAAKGSACLSRQVGAAVISPNGEVLATGRNDVPKFGGGLYPAGPPRPTDNRCWAYGGKCFNDRGKHRLADSIARTLGERSAKSRRILELIESTSEIKGLGEYCRAVHAEMDAIIASARAGSLGLIGGTLFTTTYPCHNCAKHIIAAGIHRVVYMEPYEKSSARKLHGDAIADPHSSSQVDRLEIAQYGGVAPRRYSELFAMRGERKSKDGTYVGRHRYDDEPPAPIGITRADELEWRLKDLVRPPSMMRRRRAGSVHTNKP